jgi:hypothetical protein
LNVFDQKEERHMKKKIFFALTGLAVLAAVFWVTWLHATILLHNHHTYLLFSEAVTVGGWDTT